MANQYGTKAWAKWADLNLSFALTLLKEPNKQWDEQITHLECAVKSLNIIRTELKKKANKEAL